MPVTLAELKAHLRIEHKDEDAYLEMLLRAAHATAEDFCKRSLGVPTPEPVRLAILLHAGHFFAQRENAERGAYEAMMTAFHALLWPHRDTERLF